MVAPANPVQFVRLSPSGPELGQPPQQVGGGALIAGRLWLAQGTGATIAMGTVLTDVPGLEAVPVDLRVGYKYDIEVDTLVIGTGGNFQMMLLGSNNGGVTYTGAGLGGNLPQVKSGCGRLRLPLTDGPWDHLKVQLVSTDVSGPNYSPTFTALKVREYSS
jgi:hypothetical protein